MNGEAVIGHTPDDRRRQTNPCFGLLMRSFLYHTVKGYSRNKRKFQIGGSMKQYYTWTEPYNERGHREGYMQILVDRTLRYDELEKMWREALYP